MRAFLIGLAMMFGASAGAAEPAQVDVFTSGTDGYALYRIPTLVATSSGTLLAFCEGRKFNGADTGHIDTVLKRSFDGGRTWGPLQVVWSDGNTCGNPAPIVDRTTGHIHLLGSWNRADDFETEIVDHRSTGTRRVFVCRSEDDGATWIDRREITADVKDPAWGWYATGPVHGIQLKDGRLIAPANHSFKTGDGEHFTRSHVIYSDDQGATWKRGGTVGDKTNESTLVELEDGTLLDNMRSYHKVNRRAVSWSKDRGATWEGVYLHPQLVEPTCQASILRADRPGQKPVLVFSNPASKERERMTVRVSHNDGRTWSDGLVLAEKFSAYSDLCVVPDGTGEPVIGCLYERGDAENRRYARITFAWFELGVL